ncbi:hypothetical protein GQ55_5G516900 [Panicum hallii var. hallii]|uniref:Uncharacterized protein n=1 Tax=Panicum hallii var. hallii TaxID=1504633 RepID=A0A2T7DSI4_9POAL|nr:hypothetical protein GQ55_5G516900 [Panicum hallii var. hallii]
MGGSHGGGGGHGALSRRALCRARNLQGAATPRRRGRLLTTRPFPLTCAAKPWNVGGGIHPWLQATRRRPHRPPGGERSVWKRGRVVEEEERQSDRGRGLLGFMCRPGSRACATGRAQTSVGACAGNSSGLGNFWAV